MSLNDTIGSLCAFAQLRDPAGLPHTILLINSGWLPLRLRIADPFRLFVNVELMINGSGSLFRMAEPDDALFPAKRLLMIVGLPVATARPT